MLELQKYHHNSILLVLKFWLVYLFRPAIWELIWVLCKDAQLHFTNPDITPKINEIVDRRTDNFIHFLGVMSGLVKWSSASLRNTQMSSKIKMNEGWIFLSRWHEFSFCWFTFFFSLALKTGCREFWSIGIWSDNVWVVLSGVVWTNKVGLKYLFRQSLFQQSLFQQSLF